MNHMSVCLPAIWVAAFLTVAAASLSAAPLTLYVSLGGNDAWTGRAREAKAPDGPFATLTRAQDELRKLKAAGQLPQGATVLVSPGLYNLAEGFELGPEDSGTEQTPIAYRGAGPEKPILAGGKTITGWRPWRGEIVQADMKANGMAGRPFSQLFFRGERQVRARYPNFDPDDPHDGEWAHVAQVEGSDNRREFMYGLDEEHNWAHPEDGRVHIHPAYDWAWNIIPIAQHTPAARKIALKGNTSYDLRIGDRYFIDNLLEELDAPGEWYLDPRAETLYFWPPADINSGPVIAPAVDTVVKMEGAQHVTLRGFTIEAAEREAVRIADCEGCAIAGCVVRNCGAWGIAISGGHDSGARGNDVYDCGHGGIGVTGGDRQTLQPGRNFADNNYVHHCAVIHRTYRPGVSVNGVGNTVSHNLIHDFPHAGLLLGGNENVVEYNTVHHVNLASGDTGGIYFCSRDWTQRGNIIRHNIFHHCGGFGKANSWAPLQSGKVKFSYPHFTWGIYLDDPTTGTLVYGNIVYKAPICTLHNHGGRDNTFENNILVDAPALQAGQLAPNWSAWPPIIDKLKSAQAPGSPYLDKYPALAKYTDQRPEEMSGVRFVRNIVYYTKAGTEWLRGERGGGWGGENCQMLYGLRMGREDFDRNEWDQNCIHAEEGLELRVQLGLTPKPTQLLTWPEWQALGADKGSVLADPLFVDPENHDYRLKPDSPALKLGFKQIPIDEIGPYEDELRASWPIEEAPGAAARGELHTTRYYEPPQYKRLPATGEFERRDGIGNFLAKAAADEPVKVAYFGGGIHHGGWRSTLMAWLRERYGEVEEISAGVCDCVRGSGFSLYRFEHDVLAHKPDLVLVDFASDDHQADPSAIQRTIEGVVRQARKADPQLDLLFVYAFRDGFEDDYAEGLLPHTVSAYERVADHYGVPSINMGYRIAELHRQEKLLTKASAEEAKAAGKLLFSTDGVRPSADAHRIYGEVIVSALGELSADAQAAPHDLRDPHAPDNLERARQVPITREMLSGEWEELPADHELRKRFAPHMDTIWLTTTPGAKLTFKFKGTAASIYDLMGPDTGRARITLDGKEIGVRQQVDPWAYYQRQAGIAVASGLPDEVHTATVELLSDPPDRTVPIEAAKEADRYDPQLFEGVALRVAAIRLIGELVTE